jgi:hypothetical protein
LLAPFLLTVGLVLPIFYLGRVLFALSPLHLFLVSLGEPEPKEPEFDFIALLFLPFFLPSVFPQIARFLARIGKRVRIMELEPVLTLFLLFLAPFGLGLVFLDFSLKRFYWLNFELSALFVLVAFSFAEFLV